MNKQNYIDTNNEYKIAKVSEYYDMAVGNSIRQIIADKLMPSISALDALKNEDYYQAEDTICNFIKDNMWKIYKYQEEILMSEVLYRAFNRNNAIVPDIQQFSILIKQYSNCLAEDYTYNEVKTQIEQELIKNFIDK